MFSDRSRPPFVAPFVILLTCFKMSLPKCSQCERCLPESLFDVISADMNMCAICSCMMMAEAEINELKEEVKSLKEEMKSLREVVVNEERGKDETSAKVESEAPATVQPVEEPPQETNSSQAPPDDEGFQLPSRRMTARKRVMRISSNYLPVSNFFSSLAEKADSADEGRVVLFGDSHARHLDEHFCRRRNRKRKRTTIPGGNIEDIAEAVKSEVGSDEDHVILLSSGNDVGYKRNSDIIGEYKKVFEFLVSKRKGAICAGVLPRIAWSKVNQDQAVELNRSIKELCNEFGIAFVDLWPNFVGKRDLYVRDGVHLNGIGNARLGRLLDESFLRHANFQLEKQAEVTV